MSMTLERPPNKKDSKRQLSYMQENHPAECVSDVAAQLMIEIKLRLSSHQPLRQLVCHVSSSVVALRGSVPTFFHKQLAQESIRSLLGFRRLQNDVLVVCSVEEGQK